MYKNGNFCLDYNNSEVLGGKVIRSVNCFFFAFDL